MGQILHGSAIDPVNWLGNAIHFELVASLSKVAVPAKQSIAWDGAESGRSRCNAWPTASHTKAVVHPLASSKLVGTEYLRSTRRSGDRTHRETKQYQHLASLFGLRIGLRVAACRILRLLCSHRPGDQT
jgi:hypothetical protein